MNITERELLLMPNCESIAVFGDSYKAQYFNWADGDLLLFLTSAFSDSERAAALKAGGKIIRGYTFEYFCSVSPKKVGAHGWCACSRRGIGFALMREVAEAVHKASYAAFKEDIQRCYAEQRSRWQ